MDKMLWTTCRGQNVVVKMSWTKCRGQYVLVKKCSGQDAPGIVVHDCVLPGLPQDKIINLIEILYRNHRSVSAEKPQIL